MSSETATTTGQGVGIITILGVVFIVLKLCGVIDWSWWWVLAPFWAPWALLIVITVSVLGALGVWLMIERLWWR